MYIYSTQAFSTQYALASGKTIVIHGFNMIGNGFVVPDGAVTNVDDKDYGELKDNATFAFYVNKGLYRAEKKEINVTAAASDMAQPTVEESAPMDEARLEEKFAPKGGKATLEVK